MSALPTCLLFSQDALLRQRIAGYLHAHATVRTVADPGELELLLHHYHDTILFVDLRAAECPALLDLRTQRFPDILVIALGDARSDPGLHAATAGVYAIEANEVDRLRLQTLFGQAQAHLRLQHENRILREHLPHPATPPPAERPDIALGLHHFSGAFRRFDNPGVMLENLAEGVATCAHVSRVAVFSITTPEVYRFRAGVKCLEETRSLEFSKTHPWVRWLQLHAHTISRPMLRHIESLDERLLLEKALDLTGADIILPLFGRERLIGWMALGRPVSGVPFQPRDIEDLSQLAEQVSVTIENALLHESLAVQKALAENLLQAIPVGIVATDADGAIRWFNRGAELLLSAVAADHIGQPIEKVSSQLASLLHRAMAGDIPNEPVEWSPPPAGRPLSIELRRLRQNGQSIGALAVLRDLTEERILREKQNNLERAAFWNELANAISHEVRNPLVAISTFAQLLPERYGDEDFRTQFHDLTTQEVARLNGMIDQLDDFANPPHLEFAPVDAGELLANAHCKIRGAHPQAPAILIESDPHLPPIRGDLRLLADALVRLALNAIAAVEGVSSPRISMHASAGEIGSRRPAVVLEVRDNGPGIPQDLHEKVFSPFYTTKARGVGLGLPVVRRTMIDHGGLVAMESGPDGTSVQLTLPTWDPSAGDAT